MKTYVKIYGPPLMEALRELEKIATKMPKITHYHFLVGYTGAFSTTSVTMGQPYPPDTAFLGTAADAEKVTHPVISKFGHTLGEYDFFFEWKEDPTWDEICGLISNIDKAFTTLGCKYTLTSK